MNTAQYVASSADRVLFQLTPYFFVLFAEQISGLAGKFLRWPSVMES
jgi:hypothetical protein